LKKRFKIRLELHPVVFGPPWMSLLAEVERRLPFDRTDLLTDDMPLRLHIASDDGEIPAFMRLTFKAATRAILVNKSPHLKREHFRAAFSYQSKGVNPFGTPNPEFARQDAADPSAVTRARAVQANNREVGR
jgi:hypothetical protein